MKVLLSGGRQKQKLLQAEDAEHRFERALIISLDLDTEKADVMLEYEGDPSAPIEFRSTVLFTSCTLKQEQLFVCTYTEVLTYALPTFRLKRRLSLPCFNSLHHVSVSASGTLLVVNTGLDMVLEISINGEVLREWDVLGQSSWSKFSRNVDYRSTITRPHASHPNYVFEINGEVWVTRFEQRDAICLTRDHKKIDIGIERPHDGVLYKDRIYFTTVDGHVVIADPYSCRVINVIDLRQDAVGTLLPGWCRGVLPLNDDYLLVGFTRIRKAAFMERLLWLKHGFRNFNTPSHLVLYDAARRKCVKQIDVESLGLNILFGIVPWEQGSRW